MQALCYSWDTTTARLLKGHATMPKDPADLTRESVEMVQAERERAKNELGYLIEDDIHVTLDGWQSTIGTYFDKAHAAVSALDADDDGDIDMDDIEHRLTKFAGVAVAWLDSFRAKHDR